MLITNETENEKKLQFRVRMNSKTYDEIMAYCEWAGISYRDFFIEQACEYIFKNDVQWKEKKEHTSNVETEAS